MNVNQTNFDAVVIGGGTAGMTAATQIAHAGKSVALIERAKTGGDCLYTGCVPSKSLIATARVLHQIRNAGEFGVNVGEPTLDLPRAVARKDHIVARIGVIDAPEALERAGVVVVRGEARFIDPHRVAVSDRLIRGERLVIATGSRPAAPDIPGLIETGFVTNEELMDLTTVPRRLVVIGGGAIGLELGQVFQRFGSLVSIIERADRLLPHDDAEIAAIVGRELARGGIVFHEGAEVARVDHDGPTKRLTIRDSAGGERTVEADEVLVATGRTPNAERLNLAAAGVELDRSWIRVDKHMRTTASHIWACGDVTGPPLFTHVAEDQARTVATNVLGGRASWSDRAIPWATFTDPEAAGVGLTEAEARSRYGEALEVLRLPYAAIDRAVTDGADAGLIKVLLAPGWLHGKLGGEVVGAHIAGERASELIAQFTFQMTWRLPAGLLAKTVQVYPTYSLGGRQAIGLHWTRAERESTASWTERLRDWLSQLKPIGN